MFFHTCRSLAAFAVVTAPVAGFAGAQEDRPNVGQLAKELQNSDVNVRRDAAYRLAAMGPEAKAAMPALVQALRDSDQQVWFQAVTAVARIGPDAEEATATLIGQLNDRDLQRRYRTAFALGRIGKKAVPKLRESLREDSSTTRAGAAESLGWMHDDAAEAAGDLVKAAGDISSRVRAAAARALGNIPAEARASVPKLAGLLVDSDERVASAAVGALGALGDAAAQSIPNLASLLKHDDPELRTSAVLAMGKMTGHADAVIPRVTEALADQDPSVQAAAATVLGHFGNRAKGAAGALAGLLASPQAGDAARQALRSITDVDPAVIPVLVKSLETDDARTRYRVVDYLNQLGPAAKEALPALRRIPKQDDARLRELLEQTIQKIESKGSALSIFNFRVQPLGVSPRFRQNNRTLARGG
jgi:HEAT repeat protein